LVTATLGIASEKGPTPPRADAMVRACLACHVLTRGSGDDPPALAMPESQFVAAMGAFRSGQRAGSVMNRIAAGYTEEEIHELAHFLAKPETRAK
jgi:sulfide dehydrogenase cytochrome subunit